MNFSEKTPFPKDPSKPRYEPYIYHSTSNSYLIIYLKFGGASGQSSRKYLPRPFRQAGHCPEKIIFWPIQAGYLANEDSAQSFSDRTFWKSLGVMDVRAFGSWMSAPKCLFSQDFDRPDRSFGSGYPREWPPDVRGMSVPKTSSLGWFFVLDYFQLQQHSYNRDYPGKNNFDRGGVRPEF